jgi:small-conductance mechanosensitive channel
MDSTQFLALRDWAFDLTGWPQRILWSVLAVLAGYLVGVILSRIITFASRRMMGLARKARGKDAQPNADSMAVYLLGSTIRGLGLLAGLAVSAWIFGLPVETLRDWAAKAAIALVILVAVWFLGGWIGARVKMFGDRIGKRSGSSGSSRTLFAFLSSLIRFGALAIGLIAALQAAGFPIASLVAVVGAAGLAIALALQDTLKAVAAGVVIAVLRPFRIGDAVRIAGQEGTVADISPFTTTLKTVDNKEVTITNDKAWGDVIVNNSARNMRRLDLVFPIDYGDSIDKAIDVITRTLKADPRVREEPPIWVKVTELSASSVDLRARAWCANSDWWDLRCDTLKNVKEAFDREGITIPYPHQVSVQKATPAAETAVES